MNIEKLTKYFVRQPMLFWSAVVAIVLAGVLAFVKMPKLEDPAIAVKQAAVVAVYPGATSHEVELKVAQMLEDHIRTMPDVEEIRTECSPGMAKMTVEFKMTVLKDKMEEHFDILRRKVNDAKAYLPNGCYEPMVVDDMMDVYGLFYALVCDEGYSYNEMERYAKLLQRELLSVPGVKRINIVGTRPEVININISKDKLARNGLIPTQVMTTLQNAGKTVDAGKLDSGDQRLSLRVSDQMEDENDIANVLIKTADGKTIRLGDIATVKREYKEPQTEGFYVNRKPAMAICITPQDGVVVPDVGKAVDAKLAEVMHRIPAGMKTEKIFFQPDKVNDAVSGFMINLVESVLIVIFVLMFTMGLRSGIIIGFGLVLTIAISFPILLTMGTTLQRISLGAFIVAMGMLVDNAIVIMDGILIDKQRGLAPKQYLYRIGRNTAMPLLGATVIALSTFTPVYLSPDTAGEYCRDLFLVLCVSLLASWLLALVQVPVCAKSWLPARMAKGKTKEEYKSPLHSFCRRVLNTVLRFKALTISLAVALLLLSGYGMGHVKNLFFPNFDYSQFLIEYEMPTGTSPDRVRRDLMEISQKLEKNEKIDRVSTVLGTPPARYCLIRPMNSGGEHYGELIVDCKDFETINQVIDEIRDSLRTQYPEAYIRYRYYNFSISTSHPVEAQFRGPDPAVLRKLCAQAEDIMRKAEHVDKYSVSNNWRPKSQSYVAEYEQQCALRAGVNRSNIADAMLAATNGLPVGVINDGDKQVVVNMKIRNEDGSAINTLDNIPVWSMMNINVDADELFTGNKDDIFKCSPMSAVAKDVKFEWEEPFIYRVNGERAIEAQCDPDARLYNGTVAQVMKEVKPEIEKIPLPEGYSLHWVGETKSSDRASGLLLEYAPLMMFIIVTILLLLFKSWKEVGVILLCLPFVICGICPALLAFRQPFTFMAIIGVMGLIGMMVKNGIVLVDEINRLYKEEHYSQYDAIVQATVSRVRPVIMASATTILGMLPLLGDPMYGSMALCIMSGLAMGTIITLVLLPVFYAAFYKVKK